MRVQTLRRLSNIFHEVVHVRLDRGVRIEIAMDGREPRMRRRREQATRDFRLPLRLPRDGVLPMNLSQHKLEVLEMQVVALALFQRLDLVQQFWQHEERPSMEVMVMWITEGAVKGEREQGERQRVCGCAGETRKPERQTEEKSG